MIDDRPRAFSGARVFYKRRRGRMKKDRENGRSGYLFILAAGILWGFIGLFV